MLMRMLMKTRAVLGLLALAGCATAPAPRPVAEAPTRSTAELAEPVRLETSAGSFLVHPNHAEDFSRLLAGQPTQQLYFAGVE